METEIEQKEETIDWAKRYGDKGLTVIPVAYRAKNPIRDLSLHEFWDRKPTEAEINKWFYPNSKNGIGIVISGGIIGIDIDDPTAWDILFPTKPPEELAKETWISKTSGGYHVYFRVEKADNRKDPLYILNANGERMVEVYFEKRFLIEEPSIHKSGKAYEWITDISATKIKELSNDGADGIIKELERYKKYYPLISVFTPELWKKSIRHDATMYLGGAMRKSGIELDDALWVIKAICRSNKDNEFFNRENVLKDTYDKPINDIKGYKGLKELYGDKAADDIMKHLPSKKTNGNKYLTVDKDGNPNGIDEVKLVEDLMKDYVFLTFEDSKDILYYADGVYNFGGDIIIEKECESRISPEYSIRYLSLHRISEIMGHIQRLTYISRKEFDNCDQNLIVVENGVIDIETWDFHEHSPDMHVLTKIPVPYNPDAECTEIKKFISEIINEDECPLMQEYTGYILYNGFPTHKSFWAYGSGRNGKDTYFDLVERLIGEDNVSESGIYDLENDKFALAGLYGKLLNISGEVSPKTLYKMNVFKAITGGTRVEAQRKFGHRFKFKYAGKVVVFGNKLPKIYEDTIALWERILIVRFPNQFLDNDPKTVKNLSEHLSTSEEMSGFLNWALAGLKRLQENNWIFSSSKTADQMKSEFLMQSNPVRAFFDACCNIEKGEWASTSNLYDAYLDYMHDEGLGNEDSISGFGHRLGDMSGIHADRRRVKGKGKQAGWINVALKNEDDINDGGWEWKNE